MAKIDDVARLAGVSTATVSRALRGLPSVSEQTRLRVVAAATSLGYVASPSAARLAGGRSGSVGLVVPRVTRWFFATLVDAAEEVLRAAGQDVLLFNLGGRPDETRRLLRDSGLTKRVDALMLASVRRAEEDNRTIDALGLPVVLVGGRRPGWGSVRIDDVAAARCAAEHLISLGHRRIAHLAGNSRDAFAASVHTDRRRGYHDAMRAAGLPIDGALDVEVEFTVDGGAQGMAELLHRGEPPTAVFAACDEMAMGAMRTLREAGLRVPADVSVIGIDDHDLSAVLGLTTVAQPAADEGRLAASMLLEALSGAAGGTTVDVVVPTTLVVRETTGPAAVRETTGPAVPVAARSGRTPSAATPAAAPAAGPPDPGRPAERITTAGSLPPRRHPGR